MILFGVVCSRILEPRNDYNETTVMLVGSRWIVGSGFRGNRRWSGDTRCPGIEGVLQNQDHAISIKASRVLRISITAAETKSQEFH